MKIHLIVAVSENGVIGRDNALPWYLPADLRFFRETTWGHPVLMGRKNYFSIPEKYRPLPGRVNVVLSRNTGLVFPEGVQVFHSIEAALTALERQGFEEIFVIGGAEIFAYFIENKRFGWLYVTKVHAQITGDVYFTLPQEWWSKAERLQAHPQDEQHAYACTMYRIAGADVR